MVLTHARRFGEDMKNLLLTCCTLLVAHAAFCESRFERPVVKLSDPSAYQFVKLDDVEYPVLSNERYKVSCLVYRGTEDYYVEISVTNNTSDALPLPPTFISFTKPGYTTYRTDTMEMAVRLSAAAGAHFTPTPPPYVPPTYNTTINATATTYGNQTNVSGSATTTADTSGQAGANLGNAIGNAFAAHSFYKAQRNAIVFSKFLAAHVQTPADTAIQPGQTRIVVATFSQAKLKKKPFDVDLKVGSDS
jgi:hypothetical protein